RRGTEVGGEATVEGDGKDLPVAAMVPDRAGSDPDHALLACRCRAGEAIEGVNAFLRGSGWRHDGAQQHAVVVAAAAGEDKRRWSRLSRACGAKRGDRDEGEEEGRRGGGQGDVLLLHGSSPFPKRASEGTQTTLRRPHPP